ncbi:1-acyl-sn-glycerol-3-phosphate acyltransferase [Tranquillimonas rosea]|uniref:1-acyl-sn-glycerol-3-phosphate acyltransferase n=1 Tax=Tranquillimonas rosea TaxID=641238 RepID=UPI003BA956A5
MLTTVTIPVWLLILVLLVPGLAVLDRLVGPPVRWYLRRRMERVVARLNERLERPIQPFKLARRHDMIQRLIYDPRVAEAVADHARETGLREDVAFDLARRYAREIVPSFSASAYFGVAIRLARWLSTRLYRVRLGYVDEAGLSAIDRHATVIFVMNHRSNMDYVLVTYLAAERSALAYAVGEWARVWPLSRLIRAMGAYFIRRKSRNQLYRRVLARYVQLATRNGVTQAIFPEGGLSLDGRVGPPKLGLLNYILSDPPTERDVVFVPVSLNYDRVIEDRILTEAAASGERKFRGGFLTGAAFALRWLRRRLTGRARKFGYAGVAFGSPISLQRFSEGRSGDITRPLASELMARVRENVPVLPVPLVAAIVLSAQRPLTRTWITLRARTVAETLTAAGRHVHLTDGSADAAAEAGIDMLLLRGVLVETSEGLAAGQGQEALLRYYAASVGEISPGGPT